MFVILGVLMTGVGYLIVQGDVKDKEQDKKLVDLEIVSFNLGQNCLNWTQWRTDHEKDFQQFKQITQEEFLEIWKMMPRSGKSTDQPSIPK